MKTKKINITIMFLIMTIILCALKTNSYAVTRSKAAITSWYKKYQDSSGNSTYYNTTTIQETEKDVTSTRTIYKNFKQVIENAKRGDKVLFILDMIRRNPALCMELATSEADSNELYMYTISFKTKFEGLWANRTEDGSTVDRKSKSTDNAKMSYILCNRYSGWYNWSTSTYSGSKEEFHNSECIKNIEGENLSGYEKFCKNNDVPASEVGHNGNIKYIEQTLYMNPGQCALWNFWRTWIEGEGNKNQLSEGNLYDKGIFSKGTKDIDTYLRLTKPFKDSSKYSNSADYLTNLYNNALSGLGAMKTKNYLSDEYLNYLENNNKSLKNNIQNTTEPSELEYEKIINQSSQYAKYLENLYAEKTIDETKDKKPTSETKYKYNESNEEKQVNADEINDEEKNKVILRNVKNNEENNIKVVEDGDYYKIGPINIEFSKQDIFGSLSSIELYNSEKTLIADATNLIDENGGKIGSINTKIMVALNNSGNQSNICQQQDIVALNLQTGKNIYFKISKNQNGIEKILNDSKVTLKVKQIRQLRNSLMVPIYTKNIDEFFNGTADKQRFVFIDPRPEDSILEATFENITVEQEKGNIEVIKVDSKGNKWPIENIEFEVIDSDGKVVETLTTNAEGKAITGKLVPGTYTIKETGVPDGYVLRTDTETVTVVKNTTTQLNFANPAVPTINIEGTVWLDKPIVMVKDGVLDYTLQNSDERMSNITVKLYGTSKGTLLTETDSNGNYAFENVEQRDIEKLYVEFEYNGYKYQSVPKLKKAIISDGKVEYITTDKYDTTVSKAEEGSNRETYNKQYRTIDRNSNIPYIKPTREGGVTKTDYDKFPNIVASTKLAGINFEQTDKDKDGFRLHVNLGLMERPEADLALYKDIYTATVKGAKETYTTTYNKRNQLGYDRDGWAKIEIKDKVMSQELSTENMIKRSDLRELMEVEDESLEVQETKMQLYVTYVIGVTNQGGPISTPTEIVDYCDKIYTVDNIKYATRDGGDFTEAEAVDYTIDTSKTDRNRIYINNTKEIKTGEYIYILVTLKLANPAQALKPLTKNENAQIRTINYSEINSYSTNEGLVDKDSAPGNLNIEQGVMEDDEAKSPSYIIKLSDTIEINPILTGTVWNDAKTTEAVGKNKYINEKREEVEEEIKTNIGNGYYDSGESGVDGIIVELWKEGETQCQATTKTKDGGKYEFRDILDGIEKENFYLKYIISDPQEYEATVYNVEKVYDKEQPSTEWYKKNTLTSMAKEDSQERTKFNERNKNQSKKTNNNEYKPYATTEIMKIEVEKTDDFNSPLTKEYQVNFGIMERQKSTLTVSTYIDSIKLIASDNITTISETNGMTSDGEIKIGKGLHYTQGVSLEEYKNRPEVIDKGTLYNLEINDTYISNSNLIVTYKAIVKNTGDTDFTGSDTDGGYTGRYEKKSDGTYVAKGNVVKTKVDELLVYVPTTLMFDKAKSGKWEPANKDNVKESISEDIFSNDLNDCNVLVTRSESDLLKALKPGDICEDAIQMKKTLDPITINNGNINFITSTEITKTTNEVGKILTGIKLGDLSPKVTDNKKHSGIKLQDIAEDSIELIVTPETGDKKIPYIILLVTLISLAGGIIIIKKKVIKK